MERTNEEQHNKDKAQEEILDEELPVEEKEEKDASEVHVNGQNTQLQEVIELLKRTQAMREYAAQEGILQLLPIITNLELALKNANGNHDDFKKGIELIHAQC